MMMKHFIISVHAVEKYSMALRKFLNQLQCPLLYGCSFIQELCSACNLVLWLVGWEGTSMLCKEMIEIWWWQQLNFNYFLLIALLAQEPSRNNALYPTILSGESRTTSLFPTHCANPGRNLFASYHSLKTIGLGAWMQIRWSRWMERVGGWGWNGNDWIGKSHGCQGHCRRECGGLNGSSVIGRSGSSVLLWKG